MTILIEKSKDMDQRYESPDPWGNRERKLYQQIFSLAVKKVIRDRPSVTTWYDVGCGGGNVLDTVKENAPELVLMGCDMSQKSIEYLRESGYPSQMFDLVDLEEYVHGKSPALGLSYADVISIVDVMYYFGEKRPYKATLDEIWRAVKVGAYVVVADSLIPYQRRSYFNCKPGCILKHDYTDYTVPVCEENTNGRKWHRYLKVKIYQKVD